MLTNKRPRFLHLFSFLVLSTLAASPLLAQTATTGASYSFTLKQAIDYAIANHPLVQNAHLDEKLSVQQVHEIRGIGLPQVNGTVEFQDFLVRPTSILPNFGTFFIPLVAPLYEAEGLQVPSAGPDKIGIQFGTQYNMSAGVTVSQLIFDGSFIIGLRAAQTYTELAKLNTQRTQIEAAQAVSKAYYGVLVNRERIILLELNLDRLKKLHGETKALYENGFVEKIDVDRLTVLLNNLEVEYKKVQTLVDLSLYMLKFQIGLPRDAAVELSDSVSAMAFTPEALDQPVNPDLSVEYAQLGMHQ
ncbi:MAG: TolC family protein, partial [Bacteroidota bacterium]|nr:TolC family protein [Bacteroidota bacterium]